MKYGLSQITLLKIINVLQQSPEIESAILYGSRAKGNFKPSSDIDIVLKGDDLNLQILSQVSLKLDDLLLPNKFDLSIYHHITNKELSDHITRAGKTLYHAEIAE
jgi:predicted nucleotidyltransferase